MKLYARIYNVALNQVCGPCFWTSGKGIHFRLKGKFLFASIKNMSKLVYAGYYAVRSCRNLLTLGEWLLLPSSGRNIATLHVVSSQKAVNSHILHREEPQTSPKTCRCWFALSLPINTFRLCYTDAWCLGPRGGAVGWGIVLQAGRSQVRFSIMSGEISCWYNTSGPLKAQGSTQPLTEMSTSNISWW